MKTPEEIYALHVSNDQMLERSLVYTARAAHSAIAQNNIRETSCFKRVYALLMAAWLECKLYKLLYERKGFTGDERKTILGLSTLADQWLATIDKSFVKHYKVSNKKLKDLPHSAYARYSTLKELINRDLSSLITLRNKLAHGQWAYPLNYKGDDVSQREMAALKNENILSLQFKKQLISHLCEIIHDLVVSKPTFERDFDRHHKRIIETGRNLNNRQYNKYAQSLQKKFERGKKIRLSVASGYLAENKPSDCDI